METRESKIVLIPLRELAEIVVEKAKAAPGTILPDPVPPIDNVNFEITGGMLKATFMFSKHGATVVVFGGGGGGTGLPS